jgi:hypothetical protein
VDDRDARNQQGSPRHREPRQFVSFVGQLHRRIQQRRAEAHHEEPHEAPLVTVTRRLVRVTWGLVFVGFCSIGAALLQWNAMRDQVTAFQNSILIDQRPWVSIDLFEIAGPLSYDDKDWTFGNRWHVLVKYRLKNYGKTPAAHVMFWTHMFPDVPHFQDQKGRWHGTFLGDDTMSACAYPEFATQFGIDSGQLLFSGETTPIKYFESNGDEDRFKDMKYHRSRYKGIFELPICVTYTSVFTKFQTIGSRIPPKNEFVFGADQYFTALGYRLGKQSRDEIGLDGETVSQDSLALGEPGFQATYTK